MGLVDWSEYDDLEAEDAAIRAAERAPDEPPPLPVGRTLQQLIEDSIRGTPTQVQRDTQG